MKKLLNIKVAGFEMMLMPVTIRIKIPIGRLCLGRLMSKIKFEIPCDIQTQMLEMPNL